MTDWEELFRELTGIEPDQYTPNNVSGQLEYDTAELLVCWLEDHGEYEAAQEIQDLGEAENA